MTSMSRTAPAWARATTVASASVLRRVARSPLISSPVTPGSRPSQAASPETVTRTVVTATRRLISALVPSAATRPRFATMTRSACSSASSR
ncbi:hypothetical protein [Microtetraspora malaysiensis]|uniref:Uncharacterized protein n=1 Tax=Microtetraspora malaysiensis TaxID=161358 RepID=A0ABW6SUL7_9ACTN